MLIGVGEVCLLVPSLFIGSPCLFFVFGSKSDLESMHLAEVASPCGSKNAEGSMHLAEVALRSGLDLFLRDLWDPTIDANRQHNQRTCS